MREISGSFLNIKFVITFLQVHATFFFLLGKNYIILQLFFRICMIEEEREQSLEVVMEVSRRLQEKVSYPENTLQTAIEQAQNALKNLSYREKPITVYDTQINSPHHR